RTPMVTSVCTPADTAHSKWLFSSQSSTSGRGAGQDNWLLSGLKESIAAKVGLSIHDSVPSQYVTTFGGLVFRLPISTNPKNMVAIPMTINAKKLRPSAVRTSSLTSEK